MLFSLCFIFCIHNIIIFRMFSMLQLIDASICSFTYHNQQPIPRRGKIHVGSRMFIIHYPLMYFVIDNIYCRFSQSWWCRKAPQLWECDREGTIPKPEYWARKNVRCHKSQLGSYDNYSFCNSLLIKTSQPSTLLTLLVYVFCTIEIKSFQIRGSCCKTEVWWTLLSELSRE